MIVRMRACWRLVSPTHLGVAVAGNRVCVADYESGLAVICSVPNVQSMMQVDDVAPGVPCVIEASPILGPAAQWTPLYTNAFPTGRFRFTDIDVRITDHPQKFYRARQP